jgi:hypothetical protein
VLGARVVLALEVPGIDGGGGGQDRVVHAAHRDVRDRRLDRRVGEGPELELSSRR